MIDLLDFKAKEQKDILKYFERNYRIPEQLRQARQTVKQLSPGCAETIIEQLNQSLQWLGNALASLTVNSTGYRQLERECNSLLIDAALRQGDIKTALEEFFTRANVNPESYNQLAMTLLSQEVEGIDDPISSQIIFSSLEEKLSILLAILLKPPTFNQIDQELIDLVGKIATQNQEQLSPALSQLCTGLSRLAETLAETSQKEPAPILMDTILPKLLEGLTLEQQEPLRQYYSKLPEALQTFANRFFPKPQTQGFGFFASTDSTTKAANEGRQNPGYKQ